MVEQNNLEELVDLFQNASMYKLKHMMVSLPPEEIAQVINQKPDLKLPVLFRMLDPEKAVQVFEYLDNEIQADMLDTFPVKQITRILNKISPDDRTNLFERLPEITQKKWLNLLSEEEREVTVSLLKYPDDSVGRLMTPDYIAVKPEWTVSQVLAHIRKKGHDSETINVVYVVDNQGRLIDDIRIRRFLLADPDDKVSSLMDSHFVSLRANQDQEEAIKIFKETDRVALPVTDFNGLLLGIVTVDDLLEVIEEEHTEDIQKFGGTEALDEPYMQISFLRLIKKRAGWLVLLFLSELLTSTAMGYFQNELKKALVLTIFIPLIISSGGNSGSQSSTLIIRAMALGEFGLRDWFRVMRRELMAGLSLGIILGFIGFFRITLWSVLFKSYGVHWIFVAFTIGTALIGVVTWGTLIGSAMPMILRRLGFDPAASSSPFVATLVDVTGIIIYFSVASVILQGVVF